MRTLVIAACTAFLAGCSGDRPEPVADDRDAAIGPAAADSQAAPDGAESTGTGDANASDAADIPPVDTEPWMVERPSSAPAGAWTADRRAGGASGTHATLVAVRTARHAEYDRIVFEFDAAVPGYAVEYVDSPQYQCGSGEPVRVPGDAWLAIGFRSAAAHDDDGQATIENRRFDPPPPNLRELRLICDYEGHVDWVLGVASPNPFRTMELTDPGRLVIDIRN